VQHGIGNPRVGRNNGGHLQAASPGKIPGSARLVEEFIVEIEVTPKNCDIARWARFTDIKDIKKD
jgi:hypothetical protein